MQKVAVIGAGLAGLSSGIKILENNPQASVTIYNMGHHPGGRAASWRDKDGFNIVHGFHAILKGYKNFRSLLKQAGLDEEKDFISTKGAAFFYEESSGKVHQVKNPLSSFKVDLPGFSYGYPEEDEKQLVKFALKNLKYFSPLFDKEEFDDICYTKWCIEHGMPESLTKSRMFRFNRDAYFNWPGEVSAYITLKGAELLGDSSVFFVNGTYGEKIISPLVNYFNKLGGKIELTKKLVSINHQNNKVISITVGNPDPAPHQFGQKNFDINVPVDDSSIQTINDFEALVVAIPIDCFKELNKNDNEFWSGFSGVKNLSTVATLSWQLWTKDAILPSLPAAINGLDEPMGTVIDYKQLIDEYKNNSEYGSVIEWVGQETGYENKTDDELKEIIIKSFMKISGAKNPLEAGIIKDVFRRNTSGYERYPFIEPGVNKFRPKVTTHFSNLFLAGDWIRNSIDVQNMEGAVTSGIEAAAEIKKHFKK